jgi:hypothetical protein
MRTEQFYALTNRLDSALGSLWTFGSEKLVQSGHIPQALR